MARRLIGEQNAAFDHLSIDGERDPCPGLEPLVPEARIT